MSVGKQPNIEYLKEGSSRSSRLVGGGFDKLANLPWWLLAAMLIATYIVFQIVVDEEARATFWFITGSSPEGLAFRGVFVTVVVSLIGFVVALILGLAMGLMRSSSNKILYNIASFYVEIVRGIPLIVLLLFVAFALTPLVISGLNFIRIPVSTQNVPLIARATLALSIAYGAFAAEIFRAGIQSIEAGQKEAAFA